MGDAPNLERFDEVQVEADALSSKVALNENGGTDGAAKAELCAGVMVGGTALRRVESCWPATSWTAGELAQAPFACRWSDAAQAAVALGRLFLTSKGHRRAR